MIGLIAQARPDPVRRSQERARRRPAGRPGGAAAAGERLILFAEGTSSSGDRVLPFKSALFAALVQGDPAGAIQMQPVTIAYPRFRGGLAIGHGLRPLYAWYGDMTLLPHIWSALGLPGAEVEVRFHQPVPASRFRLAQGARPPCRAGGRQWSGGSPGRLSRHRRSGKRLAGCRDATAFPSDSGRTKALGRAQRGPGAQESTAAAQPWARIPGAHAPSHTAGSTRWTDR